VLEFSLCLILFWYACGVQSKVKRLGLALGGK
jgi:hypothetical protein